MSSKGLRILFLAPQPFFQERGTPIAVKLAVEEITARKPEVALDLLVLHGGSSISIPGATLLVPWVPTPLRQWLQTVRPGISLKKCVADTFFAVYALWLCSRARVRGREYGIVHAVEEAVFVAYFIRLFFGIPYLYDMDSDLTDQVVSKWSFFSFARRGFEYLEKKAIGSALMVIVVCASLGEVAKKRGAVRVRLLRDISLLPACSADSACLRTEFGLVATEKIVLYVGNFECYQGVKQLVQGWIEASPSATLMLIGGLASDIGVPRSQEELRRERIVVVGPRPLKQLAALLAQATILVSPRITGTNTPMKIYSYLDAGKPLVATAIESHTQVLDKEVAMLCEPSPGGIGSAIKQLLADEGLQASLAAAAKNRATVEHSRSSFSQQLQEIYTEVEDELTQKGRMAPAEVEVPLAPSPPSQETTQR